MNAIFYFTSTGNSLYIAKFFKEKLGGDIIYIPDYDGDGSEYESVMIVSPIYSFGLPVHTYDLLERLSQNPRLDIVLSYGGMSGNADYFTYKLAKKGGKNLYGVYKLKMPENYTLTFSTPDFYNKIALNNSKKQLERIAEMVKNGAKYSPRKEKKTREDEYYKNKQNWHLIAHDFSTTDKCVKCGKCVSVCPVGNISLEDGKVKFADKCVACLGCYHRCPQKAIVYKSKKKKDRYINPFIEESDIGKNF